ncbi:hypothetical protein L218DRAFT_948508 [Marasmius fiardii PR-910]|nr:hypothetical protein L218DRAFT_948508 [Marasmius fiardii PR-910]
MASESAHPLRIALFSHPRTNSNLFTKLFESQPDVEQHTYPFMPGYMWGPDRRLGYKTKEVQDMYTTLKGHYDDLSVQKSLDSLERAFGETEAKGKIPLTKEHICFMIDPKVVAKSLAEYSYPEYPLKALVDHKLDVAGSASDANGEIVEAPTNPTFVPDRFMNTLTPIFIIRHPARMVPSWYKNISDHFGGTTKDSEWPFTSSFLWCRIVFDYYDEYFKANPRPGHPAHPLVVDGDDLIQHTTDIMTQVCELIHLDSSAIKYTWGTTDPYSSWPAAAAPEDMKTPAVRNVIEAFGGNIARSTGVVRDAGKYAKPLVLEEEAIKWEETWGEDIASDLVQAVRKAMVDYEYMMERRIRPRV